MSIFLRNAFIAAVLCLLTSTAAPADIITAESTSGFEGCSGDINCDGFIGIDDLNAVLSKWSQNVPPGDPVDPSGDGFVGIDDLNQVLGNWNAGTLPSPLPGDLPCTGIGCGFIGINELNIVLAAWNQTSPPANPLADRSGDGFVGIDDLNWVLSRWNAGTPPTANTVPEPTTLALLGTLGLLSLRRGIRQ